MRMICLAIFFLSLQVKAEPALNLEGELPLDLVEVQCAYPSLKEALSQSLETMIPEALQRLQEINPRVGDRLLKRLQSKKLRVTCGGRRALIAKNAAADSDQKLGRAYRIRVSSDQILRLRPLDLKAVLLHELFHFAELDNFSAAEHNQVYLREYPEDDFVYSCAFAVYPKSYYKLDYPRALATCQSVP